VSELHNRLEQLVNYSSQLIFVGSDSVANQQRNLSDFLALQHESTEVSFLTASADQSASDYRRIICRQLGDHTVGSFVRPLNELLHDLDADKGNYLVCISQAQYLDMTFLSELWEWVATCRQQQENLHINVILFAEQAWTESAQTALPAHNSNKPVLLSTQSIDAVGFDVNALENLMAHKRAFFAPDGRDSIIGKTWFIVSVLFVFFIIFMALIALQYPQHVRSFLATGNLPEPSQSESAPLQTANQATTIETPSPEEADYKSMLELVEPSITDELLVSNWERSAESPFPESQDSVTDLENQQQPSNPAAADELPIESLTEIQEPSPIDFAVEDIVSVEQLNAQLAQSAPVQATEPIRQTDSNRISYDFDEARILSLPADTFVLQLSGMQNLSVLRAYLADNSLEASTWVYQTQRYGGPWYVVLLNQSFDSIEASGLAAETLSPSVRQDNPFAKATRQVQQEIAQP
jgi:DamX protein